jgi:hypothetical protein
MTYVQSAVGKTTNGTGCAATLPANPTAGNVLVAIMSANRASGNIVIPSGFTERTRDSNGAGCNLVIADKVSDGTERTPAFTASLGNSRMVLTVLELSDVSTPPTLGPGQSLSSGTSVTDGPVTEAGTFVAGAGLGTGVANPETWGSWDNGFTTRVATDSGTNSNNIGQSVGTKQVTPSSAQTSTQTWTTAVVGVGRMAAYPATGAPPPPSGFTGWGVPL